MQSPITLTIAIPTFNRGAAVLRRVREFIALEIPDGIELLVIDNGSPDGTFDSLTAEFSDSAIRVLRNAENIGFAANFLRLLEEADTDYVTVISDEDQLNLEGLLALRDFCADKSPRFVSPRAQVGTNEQYRGRVVTREIDPEEFELASFYLSGLTFRVSSAQDYAAITRALIPANSAANVYPQALIAALSVAAGDSYFHDALVSTQVEELETHIVEANGDGYYTVPSRWAQFIGYEEFFSGDFDVMLGTGGRVRLEAMREKRRKVLLIQLERAAISEFPDLKEHFSRYRSAKSSKGIMSRILRR